MSGYLKAAVVAAALGALALPGIAVADWNDGGVEITQDVTTKAITGQGKIEDSTECPMEIFEIIKPGKTGIVESIVIETKKGVTNDPADCKTVGVAAALGCTKVTAFEATGLPWTTHNTGSVVTVTGVNIHIGFSGSAFCPSTVKVEGNITRTPDNPNSIHSYTLSGTLKSSLGGKEVAVSGTLEVTGADNGTYGL